MSGRCFDCGKQFDDMALVQFGPFKACVWCANKAAALTDLFPGVDNLKICPRCHDREIPSNQGVCGSCMDEVNAYYG